MRHCLQASKFIQKSLDHWIKMSYQGVLTALTAISLWHSVMTSWMIFHYIPFNVSIIRQYVTHYLKLIIRPFISFHTVTADFIFGLFKSDKGNNMVMIITCKFSKRVKFMPEKQIYTAADWMKIYLAVMTDRSISSI